MTLHFASNAQRVVHRHELGQIIQGVVEGSTTAEWLAHMRREGVPAAPVQDVAELVEDLPNGCAGDLAEDPTSGDR